MKRRFTAQVPRSILNELNWSNPATYAEVFDYLAEKRCPDYITNMELLIRETMNRLRAQVIECDKIENLLALSVTIANSTTCFLADLEKRMKKFRKEADSDECKREMKKDQPYGLTHADADHYKLKGYNG